MTGPAMWQRYWNQPHHRNRVVIGSDAVLPLDSASVATVDQHLLTICPKRHANGGHDGATRALPIARPPQIDVSGSQAEGTVVPVLTTGDRLPHKHAALAAAKRLVLVPPHDRPERRVHSVLSGLPATRPQINRHSFYVVNVFQVRQFVWR